MPLWLRLTFCTSAAWSAIVMLRWITPMPPWRAIAMAMRASVTLSIAADTSGIGERDVGGEAWPSCRPCRGALSE